MGSLSSLLAPPESRSTFATPASWLVEKLGAGDTSAGVSITSENALTISAVFDAVNLISSTIGTLPLHLYRRLEPRGKERADDHPAGQLLSISPNSETPPFYFWETLIGHVLLRGNGYAQIFRDGNSRLTGMFVLDPRLVHPVRGDDGKLGYEIKNKFGVVEKRVLPDSILHVRGMGFDGVVGYSVISCARESLGLGKAAEEFGASLFGNSATPSGILSHPGKLKDSTRENLRKSWESQHKGSKNANRVAVLEEGLTWTNVGINPQDAQFLETRKFQIEEIARWFNLPVHKLKNLDRATNNNIEEENRSFIDDSIMPWLTRIVQEIRMKLLVASERKTYFAEHVLDARLRGNTVNRYQAYATGRQWGILSINDVRDKENMNPIPKGGDTYLEPMNMHPAGEPPPKPEPPPAPPEKPKPEPEKPDEKEEKERKIPDILVFKPVLADALGRVMRREAKAIRKAAADRETFIAWREDFYLEHGRQLRAAIGPVADSVFTLVCGDSSAETLKMAADWAAETAEFQSLCSMQRALAAWRAPAEQFAGEVEKYAAGLEITLAEATAAKWLLELSRGEKL